MRYFHRTTLSPERVLTAAKAYFGARMVPAAESAHERTYTSTLGKVTIGARPEGGHYTLVVAHTDQVGEAEIDKVTKRFLAELHCKAEPAHELRGAY